MYAWLSEEITLQWDISVVICVSLLSQEIMSQLIEFAALVNPLRKAS